MWQLRRVDEIIQKAFAGLAASQRVGVTVVQAKEALSALLEDRMIYALTLGPPLIAIGWWLLSRPSGRAQRAAMIAGIAAPLLCLTTAWYVSATGNDVTDKLMGHAPTTTVGQNIAEVLGSGWLTTPFTCLMAAGLVYVKRHPT